MIPSDVSKIWMNISVLVRIGFAGSVRKGLCPCFGVLHVYWTIDWKPAKYDCITQGLKISFCKPACIYFHSSPPSQSIIYRLLMIYYACLDSRYINYLASSEFQMEEIVACLVHVLKGVCSMRGFLHGVLLFGIGNSWCPVMLSVSKEQGCERYRWHLSWDELSLFFSFHFISFLVSFIHIHIPACGCSSICLWTRWKYIVPKEISSSLLSLLAPRWCRLSVISVS